MHWSLLPLEHTKQIKPFIHPNLDQPDLNVYLYKTFINPGIRLTYLHKKIQYTNETLGEDVDWMTPSETEPKFPKTLNSYIYNQLVVFIQVFVSILLKFLAPTYSIFGDADLNSASMIE
jgi:hypothetical protein